MELDLSWINIVILFGAVQGLIFSLILLFNKKHPGAKFLAAFIFVFSYNGFETLNWSAGLDKYIFFFELFSFIIIFAAGPSLYLYITSLLHPEKHINKKTIFLHYGIVGFQLIYRLIIAVFYGLFRIYDIKVDMAAPLMSLFWFYAEPLSVLVFLGYLWVSIRMVRDTDFSTIKSVSKDGQQIVQKWVKALLVCMIAFGVGWTLTVALPYFIKIPFGPHYYPIEIALVFFIYWIAFVGYHRTKTILPYYPKTLTANISQQEASQFMACLQHTMETHKLYLDPELDLKKVAEASGLSSKVISATLNQHYKRSFNDFVNEYRIREVKERLGSANHQHLTITGIAFESGFNSQATFQRVFKNTTGMPPREYVNQKMKMQTK